MSIEIQTKQKVTSSRRVWIIGVIASVAIAFAAVYFWLMTAQTIASPGLRILDFLWRMFS